MKEYNHKKIETRWRKHWAEARAYRTIENTQKPKCYILDEFPYPSGEGLHTGHTRIYTASDIYARMKRMQGYNVLHPSGWDAFGLPAEQFAIKHKVHPSVSVKKNTERYKEQMSNIGLSYDWEREINTTDPTYYKWTQWAFLKMLERGLAYESFEPINWCPTCQTGLANEDLEGGNCERCDTPVIKKPMRQWVLRITKYADRLINDLDTLSEWPAAVKEAQRNWIGRSEGAEITFPLYGIPGQEDGKHSVTVFTTRPDTLFGATFIAISAELAKKWIDVGWKADTAIVRFVKKTIDAEAKRAYDEIPEKEGIFTGVYARNPANGEDIPVWIANYILSGYGSGAIMAVPAHDTRDHDFAGKYNLPIRPVIYPAGSSHSPKDMEALQKLPADELTQQADRYVSESGAYVDEGFLINSGKFNGKSSAEAKKEITTFVGGEPRVTYKLRDWVFSRQRYWGEPIPVVHDEEGKMYPVDESDLPVVLPEVDSYAPTGTGESPLADISGWVNVEGYITAQGKFKMAKQEEAPSDRETKIFHRETNTMPQWAGSSWYYLRFMDPENSKELVGKDKERYWSPVDVYVGGAEHVTRHLIYARFWHKFLYDIGVVSSIEPFARRKGVGLVLGEGGVKMSKRLGNVINPDDIIEQFGADSLRVYEMFMGPFGAAIAWSTDNLIGARRFIERVWRLGNTAVDRATPIDHETELLLNQTIKKVGEDIEAFAFNTAISQLMIFLNHLEKLEKIPAMIFRKYLLLLAPFAPHIASELWEELGHELSIHDEVWPAYDPEKILSEEMTIAIQVNGKLRDTFSVPRESKEETIKVDALARPTILKWLDGKTPTKVIYVPGRIVNIVIP
jgi:leucyl-tRNA synthetase